MDKYDVDCNGTISKEEFYETHLSQSQLIEYTPWIPQTIRLPRQIKRCLDVLDYCKEEAQIINMCRTVFYYLDRNGNGSVDRSEMRYFITQTVEL